MLDEPVGCRNIRSGLSSLPAGWSANRLAEQVKLGFYFDTRPARFSLVIFGGPLFKFLKCLVHSIKILESNLALDLPFQSIFQVGIDPIDNLRFWKRHTDLLVESECCYGPVRL